MKRSFLATLAGLASLCTIGAQADVMITEIMYNPSGPDGVTPPAPTGEWVEIYNSGLTAVDISGWRLDDEDASDWTALPAGSSLLAGEVAVICTNPSEFNTAWGAGIKVFGVTWGTLANSGSAINEVLVLLDSADNIMDTANYEGGTSGWPASSNGKSIYLKGIALDNNVGDNWAQSALGVDGAFSPSADLDPYRAADVGSPGVVLVPEPSSFGLILVGIAGLGFGLRRRDY